MACHGHALLGPWGLRLSAPFRLSLRVAPQSFSRWLLQVRVLEGAPNHTESTEHGALLAAQLEPSCQAIRSRIDRLTFGPAKIPDVPRK